MKCDRKPVYAIAATLAFVCAFGSAEDVPHDHEHIEAKSENLRSLNISVEVLRTGKIEIEQDFILSLVKDGNIKRGPILSYLTVYRGLGDLVLDHRMKVSEVLRDGKPEPFKIEDHGGITQLVIGSGEVLLDPGEHHYTVRLVRNGDWIYREGAAHWSYEITESFKLFAIDQLKFELTLPEGVEMAYCTPALSGSESTAGTGYRITETPGKLIFETTSPLKPDALMFVNAGWESKSFATQSQWLEVMKQHPKLPISGFTALLLLASLIGIVVRIIRNHRVPPVAASA